MVDLGIQALRIKAAEGNSHGAGRLDLFLAVPQGDVQQEALLRLSSFLLKKPFPDGKAFFLRDLFHRHRDLPGRIWHRRAVAGDGHRDAGFGLSRQGEFPGPLR